MSDKCRRNAEPFQKPWSFHSKTPDLRARGRCVLSSRRLRAGLKKALWHLILAPVRSSLYYLLSVCNGGCVWEDAAGVCASSFRLWSGPGLASESVAEALPGLEEAEAAGQAGDDSEKAGPGLSTLGSLQASGSPIPGAAQPHAHESWLVPVLLAGTPLASRPQKENSFAFPNNLFSACRRWI